MMHHKIALFTFDANLISPLALAKIGTAELIDTKSF